MTGLESLLHLYDYIRPVLDIVVLTFILFKTYDFISKTGSSQILSAVVVIGVAYGLASFLHLETLLWILNILAPTLLLTFVIIFQPEIRKLFIRIGQSGWLKYGGKSKHTYVDSVLIAAEMLSAQKRGMLVVFSRRTKLDEQVKSGTNLNADITSSLLMCIFGKDTTLHDGAVIITGDKIVSAGCFLPVSENYSIKKTFGTRHRAALGISEVSDAVVLIVSEESGALSLAYDSKLNYDLTTNEIRKQLEKLLDIKPDQKTMEDTIDEHKDSNFKNN